MMRRRAGMLWSFGIAVSLALGSACSSKRPMGEESLGLPVGGGDRSLPSELGQKFEVRDGGSGVAPQAAAGSAPSDSSRPPTKKKDGKKARASTPPPGSGDPTPTPSAQPSAFSAPKRRPERDPIWPAEKLVYEITYYGMAAAEFTLDVLPYKEVNGRKVYHLRGSAVSSKVFNFFYQLDDTVESFLDYEGLFSHRFQLKLKESKQFRDSLELFDSEKGEMFFWNRVNRAGEGPKEVKESSSLVPFSQDSLSALYYLRTVPLAVGSVFSFPFASELKNFEAEVTVVRREQIESPLGKIWALVVSPEQKFQGISKKVGDSYLWLSDDYRRFPIRLEARIKIGTVVAQLKRVETGTEPTQ